MEFNVFKQISMNYNDYLQEIYDRSKEFCLLHKISHNPMSDYNKNKNDITINLIDDNIVIRNVNQTDNLTIPLDFFNNELRDTRLIQLKQKELSIIDLENKFKDASIKLSTLKKELKQLIEDKSILIDLSKKYKISINMTDINSLNITLGNKIRMQQIVVTHLEEMITKLKKELNEYIID